MKQNVIYALDFDGVICDSAFETGMAAWKAATELWPDMRDVDSAPFIEQFRKARPILETGYEALLILRLLFQGQTLESLLKDFNALKSALIEREHLDITELKNLFSATRDAWIRDFLDEWLQMNPLFPGVQQKLQRLVAECTWYILTTKQERFVLEILQAHQLVIPKQRLFGLDANIPKTQVLTNLLEQHPGSPILFVEDRLEALIKVKDDPQLQGIQLQLADWGYNTDLDRREAQRRDIKIIGLDDFLND